MNVVKMTVAQAGYEADEYGRLECQPGSIKVTVIRLVRSVTQAGLKVVKDQCEAKYGRGEYLKIEGRVCMTLLCDDAALGRLYKLVHDYQNSTNLHSVVTIDSIEDMGDVIVGVIG